MALLNRSRFSALALALAASLAASSASAVDYSKYSCEDLGKMFGNGSDLVTPYLKSCFQAYRANALPSAIKASQNNIYAVETFGFKNAVFTQIKLLDPKTKLGVVGVSDLQPGISVISGKQSKISDVFGVYPDLSNQVTWVLEKDRVLVFSMGLEGNITALREFNVEAGSKSFAIDPAHNEVMVLNTNGTIYAYEMLANLNGHLPQNSVKPKRKLSIVASAAQDLVVSDNRMYLLDKDQILVTDRLAVGDTQPDQVIRGLHTGLLNPGVVYLNGTQLIVINGDGKQLLFNVTDNGDVSPQKLVGTR